MSKGSWREFDDSIPLSRPLSIKPKAARRVRIQRTKGGKGGKMVTVIKGLELNSVESKSLLKRLKACLGTGGTVKEDCLELQGDHVIVALELLEAEGYNPRQSGG